MASVDRTAAQASPAASDERVSPKAAGFLRQSTITLISKAVILVLTLVSGMLIARILGPETKGVYNLAVALPQLIAKVAVLGMSYSIIRHLGAGTRPRQTIVGTVLTWTVLWGIVLTAVLTLCYDWLSTGAIEGVPWPIYLMALPMLLLLLVNDANAHLLRGMQRIDGYNAVWVSQWFVRFLALLVLLLGLGGGIPSVIAAGLIGQVAAVMFGLYLISRETPLRPNLDRGLLADILGYGIQVNLSTTLMLFVYDLDVFLLNALTGDRAQVGYYTLAVSIAELLWYAVDSAVVVLLPRVSSGDRQARAHLAAATCRNALMLTTVGAIVLAALAQPAVIIYGGTQYLPATLPLLVLLPGVVAAIAYRALNGYIALNYGPMLPAWGGATGLIVNVALNLLLVPIWGMVGAALASVIAYALASTVVLTIFCRREHISPRLLLLPTADDLRSYQRFLRQGMRKLGFRS